MRHLYVHVPFCPTICPYCDFHVLTRRAGLVERYLEQLEVEAAGLAAAYTVELDTVYLGAARRVSCGTMNSRRWWAACGGTWGGAAWRTRWR